MADDPKFTQADIDKAIKDAVEEATKGLKDNLTAALDEAKEAKRKLRAASEITPEDMQAAEERADKAEKALSDAQKEVKALATRAEKAEKAIEAEAGFTSKLLTENALNDALAAAGVKEPAMLKAVKAMMAGTAQVVTEGTDRIVKVGDKPLADHVKEWAGTDEAKFFISAANNSGGGASGGAGGGGGGKTMTRTAFDALDPGAKVAFGKEGGKVVSEAA